MSKSLRKVVWDLTDKWLMDKSHIPFILLGCVGLVFAMKMLSGLVFTWYDDMFRSKKEKSLDGASFDEVIEARKLMMRRSEPVVHRGSEKSAESKKSNSPQLEEDTDPVSLKRKAIIRQVYDSRIQRQKDESDNDFYARILQLPKAVNKDDLKRAYKDRAKAFHPDCFDLSSFDDKTKEKLKGKIHENFLVIQKAYDYFKKVS